MSDWRGRSHDAEGKKRKGRWKEEKVGLSEGRDNEMVSLLGE